MFNSVKAGLIRKILSKCIYDPDKNLFRIEFNSSQAGLRDLAAIITGGKKSGNASSRWVEFSPPNGVDAEDILTLLDITTEIKK